MSYERLAVLIQAQREALLAADPEARTTHEKILRILAALDNGEITAGHAQRVLGEESMRLANPPGHAEIYRQVTAAIGQMRASRSPDDVQDH